MSPSPIPLTFSTLIKLILSFPQGSQRQQSSQRKDMFVEDNVCPGSTSAS